MNDIIIRPLKYEDAEQIAVIYAAITKRPYSHEYKQSIEEQSRSNYGSFVAEINGKVVGYMISYILSGSFGIQESAWIPMIGVHPQYMGMGIGKMLATEIFNYYKQRGIEQVYTSVRWYDADLLSFFRMLGFDRSEFINLKKKV